MISKMIDGQEVLMSGTSETLIAQKADKVASATNGNIASLDATGNLTDSGVKGDVSTTTLNGNPLSFTTDSEQAARECVITLEPIQAGSGDPSPSNVRAISGYDKAELAVPKKNFIDPNNFVQGLLDDAGVLHDTGAWISSNFIGIKSENVTVSGYKDGTEDNYFVRFCEYDENKVFISLTMNINVSSDSSYTRTLSLNANTRFVRVSLGFNSKAVTPQTYFATNRVQLELGSTATAYEPYNPITDYSEPLPETVYGGALNVETGELVVDKKCIDMGNLTYYYDSSNHQFYTDTFDDVESGTWNVGCISSFYSVDSSSYTSNPNPHIRGFYYKKLYLVDTNNSTSAEQKTAVTGQKLVYELATPYTIQLTPAQVRLLQGNNVVTTNGTSIKLTYRNGEVATLADVSSVAESVNALGEKVVDVISISTEHGFRLVKNGRVIHLFADIKNLESSITIRYDNEMPNGFCSVVNYAVFPVYGPSSPYAPVGSAWLYSSGTILIYKPAEVTHVFIQGTYIGK